MVKIPPKHWRRLHGTGATGNYHVVRMTLAEQLVCLGRIYSWAFWYHNNTHSKLLIILLQREAYALCIARTMPPHDVCLSVRPSVCYVVCLYTAVFCRNVSSNFFHCRAATPIHHSSFSIPKRYDSRPITSLEDPLTGASNAGVWKNRNFRQISRFFSEMIQNTAIVTAERQYELVGMRSIEGCYFQ